MYSLINKEINTGLTWGHPGKWQGDVLFAIFFVSSVGGKRTKGQGVRLCAKIRAYYIVGGNPTE